VLPQHAQCRLQHSQLSTPPHLLFDIADLPGGSYRAVERCRRSGMTRGGVLALLVARWSCRDNAPPAPRTGPGRGRTGQLYPGQHPALIDDGTWTMQSKQFCRAGNLSSSRRRGWPNSICRSTGPSSTDSLRADLSLGLTRPRSPRSGKRLWKPVPFKVGLPQCPA
jgi:hypothetical protein